MDCSYCNNNTEESLKGSDGIVYNDKYYLYVEHFQNECIRIEILFCPQCGRNLNRPYSDEDYEDAKKQGYDLDDWNDYVKYYGLGEEPNYDDM